MSNKKNTKSEIVKRALMFKYGGMLEEELLFLYDACKGKEVIELGSMVGMSSYVIASTAKKLSCVDAWSDTFKHLEYSRKQKETYKNDWLKQPKPNMLASFQKNCAEYIKSGKIKMFEGLTGEISMEFPDNCTDILFIDADHEFVGVLKDILNYAHTVRKNGFIIFHDYKCSTWIGISEACNLLVGENKLKLLLSHQRMAVFKILNPNTLNGRDFSRLKRKADFARLCLNTKLCVESYAEIIKKFLRAAKTA